MKNDKLTFLDFRKEQLIHLNEEASTAIKGGNPTLVYIPLPDARVYRHGGMRKDKAWWRSPGRKIPKDVDTGWRMTPTINVEVEWPGGGMLEDGR
ncbi:MAG TPA: hypothetical protein VKZ54_12460 [Membranihabitans sp.]|nr:hypothetical protein [Membranihabitans sp.]